MTEAMKEKIIKMAKEYVSSKKATFTSVFANHSIAYSTGRHYLNVELKEIDPKLWEKVQKRKEENINRSLQNFVKPKKKCLLKRLFKK